MTDRSKYLPAVVFQFLALIFMAVLTFIPDKPKKQSLNSNRKKKQQQQTLTKHPSSWDQIKNLLTCKQIEDSKVHDPSNKNPASTIYSSCSKVCTFRDVVHGNTRVVHRADKSPENTSTVRLQETRLLSKKSSSHGSSSTSSRQINSSSVMRSSGGGAAYTTKGMQLRKLSGCYECHVAIVDPSRYPLPIRTTICSCPECGEVFPKIESLEHHQAVRHAVSELGPEDSSRSIVEIIFKSSWLKKENPICEIERILKVHNTQRTIQRFEDYRDSVKTRAKRNARCAADGNELLRFQAATLTCTLGTRGSSSLCGSIPACGVCTIIRHGFQSNKISGIRTTASSGRAHDCLGGSDERRAMLVCRVIAGRVKPRVAEDAAADEEGSAAPAAGSYDSLAGYAGVYSNAEELYVFSARAILPCFVVIYKTLQD